MKTSPEDITVLLVGGGSIIAPDELEGVKEIIRPPFFGVANAVGAAMAKGASLVSADECTQARADGIGRGGACQLPGRSTRSSCSRGATSIPSWKRSRKLRRRRRSRLARIQVCPIHCASAALVCVCVAHLCMHSQRRPRLSRSRTFPCR